MQNNNDAIDRMERLYPFRCLLFFAVFSAVFVVAADHTQGNLFCSV